MGPEQTEPIFLLKPRIQRFLEMSPVGGQETEAQGRCVLVTALVTVWP